MNIKLRKLEMKDAPRMLEWMHDENVTRHLRLRGKESTIETVQHFILNSYEDKQNEHWAIVNQMDVYLGTISLKEVDLENKEAELAIVLHGDTIGKGIGGKAIDLLLLQEKERNRMNRIYLNVLEENQRAEKLYKKIGFEFIESTEIVIDEIKKKLNWYEYKF